MVVEARRRNDRRGRRANLSVLATAGHREFRMKKNMARSWRESLVALLVVLLRMKLFFDMVNKQ